MSTPQQNQHELPGDTFDHMVITLLENMVRENRGWRRFFNRWQINHEPLRADAKNILQFIRRIEMNRAAIAASRAVRDQFRDVNPRKG